MIMKWHLSIAAVAALIALGGTAEAGETLTAGPAYCGAEQLANGALVVCQLFNTGSATAVISSRQLFNSSRGSIAPVGNTCTSALAPLKSCEYYAKTGSGTYTCRAVITEGTLAGTMEIYSSTDQLLVSVPMTK
jgi:hypothetical protein